MRLLPLPRQRQLPFLFILLVGIALPFLVATVVPYFQKEDLKVFSYPLLLIATLWLASRRVVTGWRAAAAWWGIAFLNGVFVCDAMHPLPGWLFPIWNSTFRAMLHLVLLVFLFDIWWRSRRKAHATLSV